MTFVRDPHTAIPLLCCWDDCEKFGHVEIRTTALSGDGVNPVTYIFCTERHKLMWLFSPRGNGKLASGDRTPSVLWTPGKR